MLLSSGNEMKEISPNILPSYTQFIFPKFLNMSFISVERFIVRNVSGSSSLFFHLVFFLCFISIIVIVCGRMQLVVGGIPVKVLDTAGIRETVDQVEKIGVERSRRAANAADLVLLTIDAAAGLTPADEEIYEQVKHRPVILVINKVDLISIAEKETLESKIQNPKSKIVTAAAINQGIDSLEIAILEIVQQGKVQAADMDLAINQRQAAALTKAKIDLAQVQFTITDKLP